MYSFRSDLDYFKAGVQLAVKSWDVWLIMPILSVATLAADISLREHFRFLHLVAGVLLISFIYGYLFSVPALLRIHRKQKSIPLATFLQIVQHNSKKIMLPLVKLLIAGFVYGMIFGLIISFIFVILPVSKSDIQIFFQNLAQHLREVNALTMVLSICVGFLLVTVDLTIVCYTTQQSLWQAAKQAVGFVRRHWSFLFLPALCYALLNIVHLVFHLDSKMGIQIFQTINSFATFILSCTLLTYFDQIEESGGYTT